MGDTNYKNAHRNVRVSRGIAATYKCEVCGGAAAEWALVHDKGFAIEIDNTGSYYSWNVNAYMPLCIPCHKNYDNKRNSHCHYGHLYTSDSFYINKRGWRVCRICNRNRKRKQNALKKGKTEWLRD